VVVLSVFLCGCSRRMTLAGCGNATACQKLGLVRFEEGLYVEAVTAYKKAVAIDPTCAEAYYNMGFACGQLKQNAPAAVAYQKANDLEPKSDIANLAREAVRRLRGR